MGETNVTGTSPNQSGSSHRNGQFLGTQNPIPRSYETAPIEMVPNVKPWFLVWCLILKGLIGIVWFRAVIMFDGC